MFKTKSISDKLDEVLNAIKELNIRMDNLDEKFETYNLRLNNLELKLNKKCDEINLVLDEKANESDLEKIYDRLESLERKERNRQAQALMQKSYDKRFNTLIHGLEKNVESAWENRAQTKEIIQNFIKNCLKIDDPTPIPMIAFHRLPQRPIYGGHVKVCRPVIIKLSNAADKHLIFLAFKTFERT